MKFRPMYHSWPPIGGLLSGVAIVALSVTAVPSAGPAGSAVPKAVTAPATGAQDMAKSAHVALGDCSAKNVVMRATIRRHTYTSTQPVNVTALVRNDGSRPCTFGGTGGSPQYIGPCGSFSMQVINGHGDDIWPGPVAYSCPMIGLTHLAPHAALTATGSWPKASVTRTSALPAPSGNYRLVIDGAISFSITLT
jgi:hypothetical protein